MLGLIKRNKNPKKKKDREFPFKNIDEFKSEVKELQTRYSHLENHLKLLIIQNNKSLNDNEFLRAQIMENKIETDRTSQKLMFFIINFLQRVKNKYKGKETKELGYKEEDKTKINLSSFSTGILNRGPEDILIQDPTKKRTLEDMFDTYVANERSELDTIKNNLGKVNKRKRFNSDVYKSVDSMLSDKADVSKISENLNSISAEQDKH